ncbi:unnamed protein product [Amoebophrya sp. A120]|nr:unnamed protein product [Amoebophrya sp. A120]|eukprot:GSA120T00005699001.1
MQEFVRTFCLRSEAVIANSVSAKILAEYCVRHPGAFGLPDLECLLNFFETYTESTAGGSFREDKAIESGGAADVILVDDADVLVREGTSSSFAEEIEEELVVPDEFKQLVERLELRQQEPPRVLTNFPLLAGPAPVKSVAFDCLEQRVCLNLSADADHWSGDGAATGDRSGAVEVTDQDLNWDLYCKLRRVVPPLGAAAASRQKTDRSVGNVSAQNLRDVVTKEDENLNNSSTGTLADMDSGDKHPPTGTATIHDPSGSSATLKQKQQLSARYLSRIRQRVFPPLLTEEVYQVTQGDSVWDVSEAAVQYAEQALRYLDYVLTEDQPREPFVEQTGLVAFEILCCRGESCDEPDRGAVGLSQKGGYAASGWPSFGARERSPGGVSRSSCSRGFEEAADDDEDLSWRDYLTDHQWTERRALDFCETFLTPERCLRVAYRANGLRWRRVCKWVFAKLHDSEIQQAAEQIKVSFNPVQTTAQYAGLLRACRDDADLACYHFPFVLPWNLALAGGPEKSETSEQTDRIAAAAGSPSGDGRNANANLAEQPHVREDTSSTRLHSAGGAAVGAERQQKKRSANAQDRSEKFYQSPRALIRFCARLYDALLLQQQPQSGSVNAFENSTAAGSCFSQKSPIVRREFPLPRAEQRRRVEAELRTNLLELLRGDPTSLHVEAHPLLQTLRIPTHEFHQRGLEERKAILRKGLAQKMQLPSLGYARTLRRETFARPSSGATSYEEGENRGRHHPAVDTTSSQPHPRRSSLDTSSTGPLTFQLEYHATARKSRSKTPTSHETKQRPGQNMGSVAHGGGRISEQHQPHHPVKEPALAQNTAQQLQQSDSLPLVSAALTPHLSVPRIFEADAMYLNAMRVLCCETRQSWLRLVLDLIPRKKKVAGPQEDNHVYSNAEHIALLCSRDVLPLSGAMAALCDESEQFLDSIPNHIADALLDQMWCKV